jgi:hypothetical protein
LIKLVAVIAAAGASALATACSATGPVNTAATTRPAATASASPVQSTPTAAATKAPARLTMAQARAAYSQISAPFNAAVASVNRDVADTAPWSQFRTDTLAVVTADEAWARQVRAVLWPLQVQHYITAMLATDVPAEIQCDQAMAAAGNLKSATTVFNTDRNCKDSTANADKIRTILNLSAAPD